MQITWRIPGEPKTTSMITRGSPETRVFHGMRCSPICSRLGDMLNSRRIDTNRNLKSEMLTPPADHHNTTGQVNPAVHGRRGIVGTSLPGYPQSIDERVIRTTQELSQEFPYNEDANSGKHLGIGASISHYTSPLYQSSTVYTRRLGSLYGQERCSQQFCHVISGT